MRHALAGGASPTEAARYAADGTNPPDEAHASADYRRHLVGVLTARAGERGYGRVPAGLP